MTPPLRHARTTVSAILAVALALTSVAAPTSSLAQTRADAPARPAWARVERRRSALPTVGVVVAALGLASTVAGGAMWLVADSQFADCQATGCRLDDQPRDLDLAGVVMFWSGVGLTAAGIITYFAGRTNRRAFALDTTPRPFVGPGVLGLGGRF